MPSLKDLKNRIGSVKKTRQITSAMKLVAGAKLRKATERAVSARPYQEKLVGVLERVGARAGDSFEDPLLEHRDEVKAIYVAILTTDRGLCGPFNNNLLRKTLDWLQKNKDEGLEIKIRVYGRKGKDFLTNRGWECESVLHWDKEPKLDLVRDLATTMSEGFSEEKWDQSWLVYNEFVNTMTQTTRFMRVIPLSLPEGAEESDALELRYEPSAEGLLGKLLPLYLRTVLLQAFLETDAGEQAAKLTAMDNATRNATDLIDNLTLQYNRARQAAITKEIIEIVSGAEAL